MRYVSRVVVLAELNWIGHFETQMKLFVEIILKWGWRVIVLCPEPKVMTDWVNDNITEHKQQFYSLYFTGDKNKRFLKKILTWRKLQKCIAFAETATGWTVDIVLLTWLDGLLTRTLWESLVIRSFYLTYPWVGLYFKPKPFIKKIAMDKIKKNFQITRHKLIFQSPNCRGIAVLDEESYCGLSAEINKPIFLLPDVTDEQLPHSPAQFIDEIRERAGTRPIIGLIGVLSPRKGVLNFLRSISVVDPSQAFFILAGKLTEDEYAPAERSELAKLLLQGNNENCYFHLQYISDATTVNSLINLCDILYLVYEKFYYSSGLLTKAAVFKKPVIVSKKYCMGQRTEQYKLGITVTEGDLVETIEAIKYLLNANNRQLLLAQAEFERYCGFHQLPMLEQTLGQILNL